MALETHDLALALELLGDQGTATTALALGGFDALVIRIAAGERYEHDAAAPTLILVLEGIGSVAIDDWRATLAGGHLASLPTQGRLVVTADGEQAMSLLLTRRAAPIAASELPLPTANPTS